MDFIETEVDYYAVDVGFSTVIVHDENGIEPDATFVRKDALDRLAEENAKLREIAKALWECCAWETDSEGWCEECEHHDAEEGGCKLKKSLRELGIEIG